MKKMLFWLPLMVALLMVSCSKETGVNEMLAAPAQASGEARNPDDGQGTDPQGESGAQDNPGAQTLVLNAFSASLEDLVKATVSAADGSVSWEAGDQVLVYVPGSGATALYAWGGEVFSPVTTPVTLDGAAYLYYPASCFSLSGDAIHFSMPDAIVSAEDLGDKNPMAGVIPAGAVDDNGNAQATVKNLCSLLRVSLSGTRVVSSVVLSNSNIPVASAGDFTVAWSGSDASAAPSLSSTATGYSATLTREVDLSSAADKDFWFILPPTASQMSDMSLRVNLTSNDELGFNYVEKTRTSALALSRSKLVTVPVYAGTFSGGTGASSDPYLIANASDFKNFMKYFANGYNGGDNAAHFRAAHYKQKADISLGGAAISKIGSYTSASSFVGFSGSYNGNGKTLSSFSVTDTGATGTGLFAAAGGATFSDWTISGITVKGKNYTGGLVGFAKECTFTNCTVSGTVQANGGATGGMIGYIYGGVTMTGCTAKDIAVGPIDTATGNNFGGLIGYIPNNGTVSISNCQTVNDAGTSSVSSGIKGQAGGILGGNARTTTGYVTISNCSNVATISGEGGKLGGITGHFVAGTISHCTNNGAISNVSTTESVACVGGISGNMTTGEISDCVNNADVTHNVTANNAQAGGIVGGSNGGILLRCINNGTVRANRSHCGGLAGSIKDMTIEQCINTGTVNSTNSNVGGLVGYAQGASVIKLSYSKASNNVQGSVRVGGLVGHMNAPGGWLINCVANQIVISTGTVKSVDDGSNGAVGGLVGVLTAGTLANCVHRDRHVINRTATTSETQALVCIGGIVGVVLANGVVQNCYTYRTANNLGVYASGTTVTYASNHANSLHMGQVFGYNLGTIKECYCRNHSSKGYSTGTNTGTLKNVTVLGSGSESGYMNDTYNTSVTYSDGTTGTTVTLSNNSTSYPVASTKFVAMLTGGGQLISGYSGTETTDWAQPAVTNGWPYPSALVALGTDYFN